MSFLFKTKKPKTETPEEIERERILKSEKIYQKGVTSILDIVSPSAMNITPNYIQVGGKYVRTLFVHTYPKYLQTNWLSPVINLDLIMDIGMFIYSIDSRIILKNLKKKVAQIQSSIIMAQEKGEVRDPMLEAAFVNAEELRDKLMQGTERFFKYALYFTLYADSLSELDKSTRILETLMGQKMVFTKYANFEMEQGFNSTLPLANDELAIINNLNTSPLSTTFPFVSSELTSNEGILWGINKHNNSLIIFDRFSLENANTVVFAKSGAGKSYAVKLEILRSLMMGMDVIVIDPENEYQYLSDAVGGAYLNVSIASSHRINPFDLPKKAPKNETTQDILRAKIIDLKGLISVMLGGLDPLEDSILDRALIETYAKKDITNKTILSKVEEYPTMGDLGEILELMEGGVNLTEKLKKYTEGTFAGIFNEPTNIELTNQFVAFSIRDLEDALRPTAMYVILGYIWDIIRSKLKKRIMILDEAWWMMQNEDSARFLFGLAKRARKYYLGVTTITQDVTDFLSSSYGKPIVTNSSLQLLLKQSPAAIDLVKDTFYLTENEKYLLLETDVGEGIFFAGEKHVAIRIVASYTEDQIITTDPRQLLEIEKAKKELAGKVGNNEENNEAGRSNKIERANENR